MSGLIGSIGGKSGLIGTTARPPSGCNVQRAGARAWTNTDVNLELNNVRFDLLGEYDTSTYRFTAKYAGEYLLILNVSFADMDDQVQMQARLYKNGAAAGFSRSNNAKNDHGSVNVQRVQQLNPGDYITAHAFHGSSNSRGITQDEDTFLSITRIS